MGGHTESTIEKTVPDLDGIVDDIRGGIRGDLPKTEAVIPSSEPFPTT